MSTRSECLDTAKQYVTNDRQATHGKPENSFQDIANFWNDFLRDRLTSPIKDYEVGVLMGLFKIARLKTNPQNEDNFIDCCGYMAIGCELTAPHIELKKKQEQLDERQRELDKKLERAGLIPTAVNSEHLFSEPPNPVDHAHLDTPPMTQEEWDNANYVVLLPNDPTPMKEGDQFRVAAFEGKWYPVALPNWGKPRNVREFADSEVRRPRKPTGGPVGRSQMA